jgi:hypothetical protein
MLLYSTKVATERTRITPRYNLWFYLAAKGDHIHKWPVSHDETEPCMAQKQCAD